MQVKDKSTHHIYKQLIIDNLSSLILDGLYNSLYDNNYILCVAALTILNHLLKARFPGLDRENSKLMARLTALEDNNEHAVVRSKADICIYRFRKVYG